MVNPPQVYSIHKLISHAVGVGIIMIVALGTVNVTTSIVSFISFCLKNTRMKLGE